MHVKPMERGWKPHVEISPTCPRCGSSNTKFCYYNNYSLTQPRYFCKGCRRYWTKGGSLRNVPVGGGCRKSRRGKPFRDVIPIPPRGVSGGGPLVALGRSGMTTPTFSISANASLARGDKGSNIDLALVYANFLNQKPRPNEAENYSPRHPQIEIPMLPNAVGGGLMSFQFPSPLSQENGFVNQCGPLSNQSSQTHFTDAFCLSGLDSIGKHTDHQFSSTVENRTNTYGLPPLPGEELNTVVSQGLVWSGSNDLIFPSHTLMHATQLSGIEEQTPQAAGLEPKQLGGDGSQVNLPIELCNVFRP